METVKITTDYITLGQLLKLTDVISNGGEAKTYLATHPVTIDGEPDNRRGRKIYPGSTVVLEEKTVLVSR